MILSISKTEMFHMLHKVVTSYSASKSVSFQIIEFHKNFSPFGMWAKLSPRGVCVSPRMSAHVCLKVKAVQHAVQISK